VVPVGLVRLPGEWAFVIASSGVAAQKTGPARERYNSVAGRARALVSIWNAGEAPRACLREIVSAGPGAVERLRVLVRRDASGGEGPALLDRLEHFLREDARVPAARDAFAARDAAAIGALAAASQLDAETLLGNQVPETITLASTARHLGAFAASAFGAGFGGSVWALVPRAEAQTFAQRWLDDYLARFPSRTDATVFTAPPGPGVGRVG
jgi:galactokinase